MKNQTFLAVLLIVALSPHGAAQSGGGFQISQAVIASGGQTSIGGNFAATGTTGQGTVGANPDGGAFAVRGGFWGVESAAPTAASVTVSGRVDNGRYGFIRRVQIRLIDVASGLERTTQTGFDGRFTFEEVEIGRFYIIRAESKKFRLTPGSYSVSLTEALSDIDFTIEN